jgi:hypothetical protein
MKSFAIAGAAIMLFAATASAADLAVSKSTLGSMGLGSMQMLSDDDGLAVRGKGTFANVWGGSQANWYGGQSSANNYEAGASWLGKSSSAGGNSLSFAGKVEIHFAAEVSGPPLMFGAALQVHAAGGIAGGSANAWAN